MRTTMTSNPSADVKAPVDAVDALWLLVADLRALSDRLALSENPEQRDPERTAPNPRFVETLKAAEERVSGPRAVVMLLSEHPLLKRRFLERLLGPLSDLPEPVAELLSERVRGPVRLEYGLAAERVAPTAEQAIPVVRLPASTLERGLAVIDTPAIETPVIEDTPAIEDVAASGGQGGVTVLQCAEQANAWIFVLAADHAIGKTAQTLLRQLPEQAAGLEFVVEGAEALNATARAASREQLTQTLRENCGITEPRLTLIASAATEGDEGTYWHGKFATFHSVMMLRGRERWLQATRALIANALNEVGAEIEQGLQNSVAGLRQARLRLGLKDLEGLRTRFHELGRLEGDSPSEAASASGSTGEAPAPPQRLQPVATEGTARREPPPALVMDAAEEAWLSEQEARELLEAQAWRGSRSLRAKLGRLFAFSRPHFPGTSGTVTAVAAWAGTGPKGSSRPWRLLGGVWAAAFVVIVLWIMWPRLAAERESAAEWGLRQQNAGPASKAALATPHKPAPSLVVPAVHAETEHAGVGDTVPPSSRTRAHPVIRTPLAKPMPQGLAAGAIPPPRRHHSFLGIGKLWGWVRHPRGGGQHSTSSPTAATTE
jgi:hypothetical protein